MENLSHKRVSEIVDYTNHINEISSEEAKETHEKLREILIKYGCPEYRDCIVDEISFLFGHPTTIDTDDEE